MNGKVARYIRKLRHERKWSPSEYRHFKTVWDTLPWWACKRDFFINKPFTHEQREIIMAATFTPAGLIWDITEASKLVKAGLMTGAHHVEKCEAAGHVGKGFFNLNEQGARAAKLWGRI